MDLSNVYLNPDNPAYLAGVNAVYREAKKAYPQVTLKNVIDYLNKQNVYSIHKGIKHKFPRNRIVPSGLDTDWQLDLICLPTIKRFNSGHAYILACIDVLSKFGWAVPIKNKKPESVREAFRSILESSGRKPWRIMTDSGTEFKGVFREYLKSMDIQFFTATSPDVKAANAERYIRTLKTRLWKHFTLKKTFRFLCILPKIVAAINHSVSTVTKHRPVDVTPANEVKVKSIAYGGPRPVPVKFLYKEGDTVRIVKAKGKLCKGYVGNFSQEVFVISKRLARHPPAYRLTDLKGEEITGIFYHAELTHAPRPPK